MQLRRPQDIGALVREYRASHGLSQTALARKLKTSQRWVSELENGKQTLQLGLVMRVLNEIGIVLETRQERQEQRADRSKRTKFSIDDIVDG